jgi:hypothetical protein
MPMLACSEWVAHPCHGEIHSGIGISNSPVGEVLDLQAQVQVVLKYVANADVVAELEIGGKRVTVIVVFAGQIMSAYAGLCVEALQRIIL